MLTPKPFFMLIGTADPGRADVEAYIADKFHTAWQARVTSFLPFLLSMQCLGVSTAVAGIRPAARESLFLEHYLDTGVEDALTSLTGREVPRRHIAEIGNLVTSQRGASHLLFLVFTAALHQDGYRWIVFTATHALRNNLQKLGFPLLTLAPASAERLDSDVRVEWGSYYDSEPLVMGGNLDDAMRLIAERPALRRILRLYRATIREVAAGLREYS